MADTLAAAASRGATPLGGTAQLGATRGSTALGASRSMSASPRLKRSGLVVTTAAPLFTGPPPAAELDPDPQLSALESRQRAVAGRRVELLKRQAALSAELHDALAGDDGLAFHATRALRNTQRAIAHGQRRGGWEYYSPPPRVKQLDSDGFLGGKTRELAALQRQVEECTAEERRIGEDITRLHVGAVAGRGTRASGVTTLAAWRATYGAPNGYLAASSPGYASEWVANPRRRHHAGSGAFPAFASSGVTLKLGRDLK